MYDLVIVGAHVIDPARNIDGVTPVAVANKKIAAVGDEIDPTQAEQVIHAEGKYLTPGWFDMHVHTYSYLSFSHPDTIGVLHGVPTLLDAGGGGAWTYDDMRHYWEGHCKSDIFAFLMFNAAGIDTGAIEVLDVEANRKLEVPLDDWKHVVERNRDRVKMVKTAAITRLGFRPVQTALDISEAVGLPIYVHIGDIRDDPRRGQPRYQTIITREVLNALRPGDVITHVYTGNWGNLLDPEGKVYPEMRAAQQRGVHLDVGFGSLNFDFKAYDNLMAQGIVTDVISSDLQAVNITGPAFSLAHVASLFLNFGLSLGEVIERLTINPARIQGLDWMIGSLSPGYPARITVFELQEGEWLFRDCAGGQRTGKTKMVPSFCVMDGEVIESDLDEGQAMENWHYAPNLEELPPKARTLDAEQREFIRHLAQDLQDADWSDGRDLHWRFRHQVQTCGIDKRKAANAIYDLILESRFAVAVGWMLNALDREQVLHRMQQA